jgi:hypothetical protein
MVITVFSRLMQELIMTVQLPKLNNLTHSRISTFEKGT